MKHKKDNIHVLEGKLEVVEKIVYDLKTSPLHSPFNKFFLRDCFVKRYRNYFLRLERKIKRLKLQK